MPHAGPNARNVTGSPGADAHAFHSGSVARALQGRCSVNGCRKNKRLDLLRDSLAAARAAELVYVSPDEPGIRRIQKRRSVTYVLPNGRPLTHARTLRRIGALAIPPAWQEVWICRRADGHVSPLIFDAYLSGALHTELARSLAAARRTAPVGLEPEESAVLALFERLSSTRQRAAA